MNAPYHPLRTAADLLAMLEQATDLPPLRKRDMISAVNRISKMAGCPPAALRLDVPSLRARLAGIRPAMHGITPSTSANVRCLFAAALACVGVLEHFPRGAARRHAGWAPLAAAIAGNKRLANGLATFMNWCAFTSVEPVAVDDAVLREFLRWLEARTLHARPRRLVREVPALWREAQSLVPEWPATELARISFRPISPNLRWEDLPEGLRADAEAYLAARANPDLFDEKPNAPTRALAPSTLRQQQQHIRLAASVFVREGKPIERLNSLADLVALDAARVVLRHYHDQVGGKPNAYAICLGRTLIDIARYHVGLPEAELKALKKLVNRLPPVPFDLTEKNKELLRELEADHVRARLLCLPEELVREVKRALATADFTKFVDAQVAVAVDILLVAPLRAQNLIALNWGRNFMEPDGPRGKLLLYIPKDATKSKRRDLTFEISPDVAETIRWYRREILPRLGGDSDGDLFVTKGGRGKSQETLSQQITELIKDKVGIPVSPHQFRHVAAMLYLDAHPEDFQTVTDLLGHAWAKSTLIYAGSSSRRASRVYGDHIVRQREALALRRPRRTRK
jgi:integrase